MPDDPREILKAAGVECAEVDKAGMARGWYDAKASHQHALNIIEIDDAAILALARLVAEQAEQLKRLAPRGGPDSRVTTGGGCEHGPWLTYPSGGGDAA